MACAARYLVPGTHDFVRHFGAYISSEGQKRELVVKQAERVPRHIMVARISEIEEQLSEGKIYR